MQQYHSVDVKHLLSWGFSVASRPFPHMLTGAHHHMPMFHKKLLSLSKYWLTA